MRFSSNEIDRNLWQPESLPALEVLFSSNEMLGDSNNILFVMSETACKAWELACTGITIFVKRNARSRKKHYICQVWKPSAPEVLFSSNEIDRSKLKTSTWHKLKCAKWLYFAWSVAGRRPAAGLPAGHSALLSLGLLLLVLYNNSREAWPQGP